MLKCDVTRAITHLTQFSRNRYEAPNTAGVQKCTRGFPEPSQGAFNGWGEIKEGGRE